MPKKTIDPLKFLELAMLHGATVVLYSRASDISYPVEILQILMQHIEISEIIRCDVKFQSVSIPVDILFHSILLPDP